MNTSKIDKIVSIATRLSVEERIEVVDRLREMNYGDKMYGPDRYALLVGKAEVATGHFLGGERTYENTLIRRFVSKKLHDEGYRPTEIARLMNVHHSTVCFNIKTMDDMLSLPNAYSDVILKYREFESLVSEFDNG